ncbi:MAG: UDP-N-acetylmuramyl-tripeptide synthetase [Clostridia bacterium]|nr:UDP-N-acetylmuramyl-tripeptide synthetase [Clostridia bacterium]
MIRTLKEYESALRTRGLLTDSNILEDLPVRSLACDTREMEAGALFVCKGEHFRREYLDSALDQNAVAYVSTECLRTDVSYFIVHDVRAAMATLVELYYGDLMKQLTAIGITGTKGKSTVAFFVRSILAKAYNRPIGIVSSVITDDGRTVERSINTTPEIFSLYAHCATAIQQGCTHMVIEASSQALKYGRTAGIRYRVGCFTNFENDHISPSEHPDVADYFNAKLSMIRACDIVCINRDMTQFPEVLEAAESSGCRVITYGTHPDAKIRAFSIHYTGMGYQFSVKTDEGILRCTIQMHGEFNVSNALAAVAIATALEIDPQAICDGLTDTKIAGRMDLCESEDGNILSLTDYAHNKLSFEAIYSTVQQEFPDRYVVTVFGAPGDKALNRRKELGTLAALHSNHVFVTEDDTGESTFDSVAQEICTHLAAHHGEFSVIQDREKAIAEAFRHAAQNTPAIVLLLGKGDDKTQKCGTGWKSYPSDTALARQEIQHYNEICISEKLTT